VVDDLAILEIMVIPPFKPKLLEIAESEQTPLVRSLLPLIAEQQEQIQRLTDEVRRLKGGPPRPQLKPNTLEPAGEANAEESGVLDGPYPRRRGPHRAKTAELVIHETCSVPLVGVPDGSRFKGYRRYVVQEVEIRTHNTGYLLEQWQFPTGEWVTAPVPLAVHGGHYGPQWVSYLLHQYYHAHVTQPLLLAQMQDWGIEMSAGQLNHLLTEDHHLFHQEKAAIKATGLAVSAYFQADDTGTCHRGRSGYCTSIGNEWFAWLASTDSKSRGNCLERLQVERRYEVNAEALAYMAARGWAAGHREMLAARPGVMTDPKDWAAHLRRNLVGRRRAVALATEGALIGGLVAPGFNLEMGVLSDDAGQFARFVHGLCWVHAERPLQHLLPLNESDRQAIAGVREQIWGLYRDLKTYRQAPDPAAEADITRRFEALYITETCCEPLNQVLRGFQHQPAERLRVLDRPDLPLHNNRSENDLRDRVKKRKISAGTRSEVGRQCRDTFASLKKTCRKHGLSFWEYLKDRVSGLNVISFIDEMAVRHEYL